MAYVLGFMFADGSLVDSDSSSRTYYLCFDNNDFYVLNAIREAMKSNHKIYHKPPRFIKFRTKKYRSKAGYVLRIGNKKMYHDLLKLGMKHRKSLDMTLPEVPDQYFPHFLRGYFDGDGCINLYVKPGQTTPRLTLIFTSGSTDFLEEIAKKVGKLLSINPPSIYRSMGAHNLECKGIRALKIFDYMYTDLDDAPYMRRKYLKYCDYRNNLMGPRVRKVMAFSLSVGDVDGGFH